MNGGYALYNNYLVGLTESASESYYYSYKPEMNNGYCDLCIDGYSSSSLVDFNEENCWTKHHPEF